MNNDEKSEGGVKATSVEAPSEVLGLLRKPQ